MAYEIERKFLVNSILYKDLAKSRHHILQGYLNRRPESTVRIRIIDNDAYLTVKGKNSGMIRLEYEYRIPIEDAREMLTLCEGKIIEKFRWIVIFKGYKWEIDEFSDHDNYPTIAEIELKSKDEEFPLPPFVGMEVTGDPSYYNSNIGVKE